MVDPQWARLSPEERAKLIIMMWAYSAAVTAIELGLLGCVAVSARRIWRLRDRGLVPATVDGGLWQGFAWLGAAAVAQRWAQRRIAVRLPRPDGAA